VICAAALVFSALYATSSLAGIRKSSANITQVQNDSLEAQLHLAKVLDALHFLQVQKGSAAPEKQQVGAAAEDRVGGRD